MALALAGAIVELAAAEPLNETVTAVLRLKNGVLVEGPSTIRATVGDTLLLIWHSNRAMELHLHGYDLRGTVKPGPPTTWRVEARFTGRFPVEVHDGGHHLTLAYVEIHPE